MRTTLRLMMEWNMSQRTNRITKWNFGFGNERTRNSVARPLKNNIVYTWMRSFCLISIRYISDIFQIAVIFVVNFFIPLWLSQTIQFGWTIRSEISVGWGKSLTHTDRLMMIGRNAFFFLLICSCFISLRRSSCEYNSNELGTNRTTHSSRS